MRFTISLSGLSNKSCEIVNDFKVVCDEQLNEIVNYEDFKVKMSMRLKDSNIVIEKLCRIIGKMDETIDAPYVDGEPDYESEIVKLAIDIQNDCFELLSLGDIVHV